MATYTSTSGSYTTTLTVNQTSQSIENNTSTLTYSLTLTKNAGTGLWNNNSCPWSITINGTTVSGTFTYDFRNYSSLTLKSSTTMTVTHNNDGTKSVSVSASVNMNNSSYVSTMTPSGTLTLTTIPRASDVSVSAYTVSGTSGSLSFTITSKANFWHKWRYKLNSVTSNWSSALQINTTSSSPTITNTNLLNAMPTQQVSAITIEVQTYSDSDCSTLVGTKTASANITVTLKPSAPTLTTLGFRSRSSGVDSSISTPVAGYTTVALTSWTSGTSQGATSYTTYFSVNQGATLKTSSATANNTVIETNTLPANAKQYTLTYTAYTVDSRGLQSSNTTKTVDVYGYQPPVASLTAFRTSSDTSTTEDGAGVYARVSFTSSLRGLANTSGTLISSNPNSVLSASCSRSGYSSGTCTTNTNYALPDSSTLTFTYTVKDKFTTSTATVTVSVATYALDLYDNGSGTVGVGLGTLAVSGRVQSALPISVQGLGWFEGAEMHTGSTTYEHTVYNGVHSIAGKLFLSSSATSTGTKALNAMNNAGTYKEIISVDQSNNATFNGTATNATNAYVTNTNPTSGTWYRMPFTNNSDNTNLGLRSNNGLLYYCLEGTASTAGVSILRLGNATASGTAGNKRGRLRIYADTAYLVDLYASATANRTQYLPNQDGVLMINATTSASSVVTRTSGLTLSSSAIRVFGKVVQLQFLLTGSQSNTVGANAFVGKISNSAYYPVLGAQTQTYYGSTIFAAWIDTSGNITVRTLAAATNITTDTITFVLTYIIA